MVEKLLSPHLEKKFLIKKHVCNQSRWAKPTGRLHIAYRRSEDTGRPQLNVTICFVHRMITVGPIVIKFHPQKAVILRNCKSI